MSVDITVVPSKFVWRTSPRKRPPPSARVGSFSKPRRRRQRERRQTKGLMSKTMVLSARAF